MLKNNLTDSELLEAIIINDEKAFNQLFERHWSKVYTMAFRYVKDQETCLEITHDVFLNIWKKRHELHIKSFKSYVITAASYHGIRKKQILKAIPINYVENYEYTEDNADLSNPHVAVNFGETALYKSELDLEVDHLLNDLPKRCREIYTMSRKENLSIAEIADRLQISRRTVENQLSNALKHLRNGLKYILLVIIFRFLQ
ncbi:RNA polymerase sigma-70 factor [Mucilaginibacter sabulilitoris]|uniref:RNA polymerase sigma-70 factor n=1 Tax=Mucilaginibacter sabulilitoris TaxID=1173583 RepID=A0ABZ0TVW4_9SPHI|nr:RNA polymerase sigma-70 factor [Mucilaginibacter sabulilitoris]WPU96906.1 RNA polymerase sigma-70 factor [Mucilaginibacter sabulilitoris]